jgi:hypothetical protein
MKLHSRQKLVLHKETLRVLKVKTGIKGGLAVPPPPPQNPTHCG